MGGLFTSGFQLGSWMEESLTISSNQPPAPTARYADCWMGGQTVKTFVGTFTSAQPMHFAPRHTDRMSPEHRRAKFKILREILENGKATKPKPQPGDSGIHSPSEAQSRETQGRSEL